MLRTGKEHIERLKDGRIVYIGSERVDDVTTHPAFRNAARTVTAIYDMKADPANSEIMSFSEAGDTFSMYYLKARTQEDLRRRMRAHQMIAEMTYGLFGRSPDHVASFVTGMAVDPTVFATGARSYADNLVKYYRYMREQDVYAAYVTDRTRRTTMKQRILDHPVGQSSDAPSEPRDWRHPLWLGSLVVASIVFSLGFACAVPLAAFAAAAALSLSRRDALLLILLVWLANQLVGFTVLHYPWTASTFTWGVVLGAVALLATLASQWIAGRLVDARRAFTVMATFLVAFAVYEAALFTVSATLLGGTEIYTVAIQGRIFAINAAAFVGLLVLNHLATSVGLVNRPTVALSMKVQHV